MQVKGFLHRCGVPHTCLDLDVLFGCVNIQKLCSTQMTSKLDVITSKSKNHIMSEHPSFP
jgi:hypothetical protein